MCIIKVQSKNTNKDKCEEIGLRITFKTLPAQVIVKDFIENEIDCNYEVYLMELLNQSKYFRGLSFGEEYHKPISEENGQADAISGSYSIDFKLLISKSSMEGKSILSTSITKYSKGFYVFGAPKARDITEKECTNLFQALRKYSTEDLERIENAESRDLIQRDMASFLRVLRTQKNILGFGPYEFNCKGDYVKKEAIEKLMEALHQDLKASLLYREKNSKGFDTYIVTIFVDKFIVFKMDAYKCELVDTIDTKEIKTFERLMSIDKF